MSGWGRFLLATMCGLMLAGIVHIAAVLSVPWLSEQDAFSRLRGTLAADRSEIIAAPGKETWLPHPDPAAALAACAYNLDEGPLRVSARTSPMFEIALLPCPRRRHLLRSDRPRRPTGRARPHRYDAQPTR